MPTSHGMSPSHGGMTCDSSTLVLISAVISPGVRVAQRPVLAHTTSPPSTQRSVICTGRQSCLQPRAHESLCRGSGAPVCESRVTETQPSARSPGFMACTSPCPTVSYWSFISCGIFSTGTIKGDGRIDGQAPATWQKAACQAALRGISFSQAFLTPVLPGRDAFAALP